MSSLPNNVSTTQYGSNNSNNNSNSNINATQLNTTNMVNNTQIGGFHDVGDSYIDPSKFLLSQKNNAIEKSTSDKVVFGVGSSQFNNNNNNISMGNRSIKTGVDITKDNIVNSNITSNTHLVNLISMIKQHNASTATTTKTSTIASTKTTTASSSFSNSSLSNKSDNVSNNSALIKSGKSSSLSNTSISMSQGMFKDVSNETDAKNTENKSTIHNFLGIV